MSICILIQNFTLLLAHVNTKSYVSSAVYTHTRWKYKTFNVAPWTLDSFVQILGSAFWQLGCFPCVDGFFSGYSRFLPHPTDTRMSGDSKLPLGVSM